MITLICFRLYQCYGIMLANVDIYEKKVLYRREQNFVGCIQRILKIQICSVLTDFETKTWKVTKLSSAKKYKNVN